MSSCSNQTVVKSEPNDSDLEPGQARLPDDPDRESVGLKVYLLKEEKTDEATGIQSFKIDIKTMGKTNVTLMVDTGVNTDSTNENLEERPSCSSASSQTDETTGTTVKHEPEVDVVGVEKSTNDAAVQTLKMPEKQEKKIYGSLKRKYIHEAYCDYCSVINKKYIKGVRYRCLVCKNFDLCADCEHLGIHLHHAMVRISNADKFLHEEIPGLIERRKAKKRKDA